MAHNRANETPEASWQRKLSNKSKMAVLRANETPEASLQRKLSNKSKMAVLRANETPEASLQRKLSNKSKMAVLRANETPEASLQRKLSNKSKMAVLRANETPEASWQRKLSNKSKMAVLRANETPEASLQRKLSNKSKMAVLRANETPEASLQRKLSNKSKMAVLRANETPEASLQRKHSNKEHMSVAIAYESSLISNQRKAKDAAFKRCVRNPSMTINDAISNFLTKIRLGPDFVCTVCHRMMYFTNVVSFDRNKYNKGSPEMLEKIFSFRHVCPDHKEYICLTCSRTLKKGKVPVLAKANGLGLETIPPELEALNELELRLISLRIPFMKMVSLPCRKQRGIHGPAVNVTSNVDTVVDVLPRLPSQCELIPLKLKRKLAYKGHYMYQYVRPTIVLNALKWLKINNPLYANVNINEEWLADSACDDRDVFEGLFEQPNNDSNTPQETESNLSENSTPQQTERNVAVSVPCHSLPIVPMDVNSPYSDLSHFVRQHGYTIHDVPPDGSCLFHAISYNLRPYGIRRAYFELRNDVSFLRNNPCMSDGTHYSSYVSFNESAIDGDMLLVDPTLRWECYLDRLSRGAWGDHLTIRGLSEMLIAIYCSVTTSVNLAVVVHLLLLILVIWGRCIMLALTQ